MHGYLWLRLVRLPQLGPPWRALGAALCVGLAILVPLSLVMPRVLGRPWAAVLSWPGHVWLGLMLLLFSMVLAADLIRALVALATMMAPNHRLSPGQWLTLNRGLALLAVVGATLLGTLSIIQGDRAPRVRDLAVSIAGLPPTLAGRTIVQLTDMHVGAEKSRRSTEAIVRRTNELQPDLVVITGDLVEGRFGTIHGDMAPLADLKAAWGVFMVTGNHEYYSGVREWLPELERLGIRVLRNESVAVGPDQDLQLAGIDDWNAASVEPGHGPDLGRALGGLDPKKPVILLTHQPKAAIPAARLGASLVLAGHTHGGQIWPFNYLVRLQQPFIEGAYTVGRTLLYVSPGTGYWGPPMRLGTRAEITRITMWPGSENSVVAARPR